MAEKYVLMKKYRLRFRRVGVGVGSVVFQLTHNQSKKQMLKTQILTYGDLTLRTLKKEENFLI